MAGEGSLPWLVRGLDTPRQYYCPRAQLDTTCTCTHVHVYTYIHVHTHNVHALAVKSIHTYMYMHVYHNECIVCSLRYLQAFEEFLRQ